MSTRSTVAVNTTYLFEDGLELLTNIVGHNDGPERNATTNSTDKSARLKPLFVFPKIFRFSLPLKFRCQPFHSILFHSLPQPSQARVLTHTYPWILNSNSDYQWLRWKQHHHKPKQQYHQENPTSKPKPKPKPNPIPMPTIPYSSGTRVAMLLYCNINPGIQPEIS